MRRRYRFATWIAALFLTGSLALAAASGFHPFATSVETNWSAIERATELPQEAPRPIIDMHLHAIPVAAFPDHWDEWTGIERPPHDAALLSESIRALDEFGVERAVTSGSRGLLDDFLETAPDRIVPSLMVGAHHTRESLSALADSLEPWYESGLFEVIGEVATQYAGIPPADPSMEAIFAFAAENDVPVGIHMGIGPPGVAHDFAPEFEMRLSDPLELEPVLKKFPELRIYVMHAGYPLLDRMLALMHMYPQVYAEISEINWLIPEPAFHRYLQALVEAGFENRILFGSDQMVWPEGFRRAVESIESAQFLSEEQKHAIFYANAASFLDL